MSDHIRLCLLNLQQVYALYTKLLDSYVSDFYIESHWNKLPQCWELFFENVAMQDLGNLLDLNQSMTKKVFPLSIICLKKVIVHYGLRRYQETIISDHEPSQAFLKYFWKNVKEKKRHEIALMSKNCWNTASKSKCRYIVDIGSGLGHLSRLLTYGYDFQVCTFEANPELSKEARLLDVKFEDILSKQKVLYNCIRRPVHINKRIDFDITSEEFLTLIMKAFNVSSEDFKFGIVGLHPCGNLGATLLRLYTECPNAVFINMASCCYMKLGLEPSSNLGFPLSKFCKSKKFLLTYLSCEMACHSIECYAKKLKHSDYDNLKIHAYRAALELIIGQYHPQLRHTQLSSVKYDSKLTVKNYCERALRKNNIKLPESDMNKLDDVIEGTWKKVLSFYSIRLLLAPLVESIILYDRILYVIEYGSQCKMIPLFDPEISPRNHVLSANKELT